MKKSTKVLLGLLLVVVIAAGAIFFGGGQFGQGYIGVNNVNRAEFSKMLVEAADIDTSGVKPGDCSFTDVSETDWYFEFVCVLSNDGYIDGYADGTFGPDNDLTRKEAAKLIHSVFAVEYSCELPALFKDLDEDAWYYEYVNELAAHDFFKYETKIGSRFYPDKSLSQASAKRWFSAADVL